MEHSFIIVIVSEIATVVLLAFGEYGTQCSHNVSDACNTLELLLLENFGDKNEGKTD